MNRSADRISETPDIDFPFVEGFSAFNKLGGATQTFLSGLARYTTDFFVPYLISTHYFQQAESDHLPKSSPLDNLESYLKLNDFNNELMGRGVSSAMDAVSNYAQKEMGAFLQAMYQSVFALNNHDLNAFATRQAELMDRVVRIYPQMIQDIEPEYGFHFERGVHKLIAETDRFYLYQITPSDGLTVRMDAKPVCILPPYVLGANILGFLPGENKSYVHCFANQGIPTYILSLIHISEPTRPY